MLTDDQLKNLPNYRNVDESDREVRCRQTTASFIQEIGQRLKVSQLCINTAIVYMHRFYAYHSFEHFNCYGVAASCFYLASKVEETPRRTDNIVKAANMSLNEITIVATNLEENLSTYENVLLQTIGFDLTISHPHTDVIKICQMVKASKYLAIHSYYLATCSLHLTSMCLLYNPTVVACACVYMACKWAHWEIPKSPEGLHWFHQVNETVTIDLMEQLADELLTVYEKSPPFVKSKFSLITALVDGGCINIRKDENTLPLIMQSTRFSLDMQVNIIRAGIHSNKTNGNRNCYRNGNTVSSLPAQDMTSNASVPPEPQTPLASPAPQTPQATQTPPAPQAPPVLQTPQATQTTSAPQIPPVLQTPPATHDPSAPQIPPAPQAQPVLQTPPATLIPLSPQALQALPAPQAPLAKIAQSGKPESSKKHLTPQAKQDYKFCNKPQHSPIEEHNYRKKPRYSLLEEHNYYTKPQHNPFEEHNYCTEPEKIFLEDHKYCKKQ